MKTTRKRTKSKEREDQLTVEGERRREREEERAKQRASFFFETSGKKRKEKKKKKESLISFLLLSCSLSRGYIIITALSFIYFLLCAVVAKGDVLVLGVRKVKETENFLSRSSLSRTLFEKKKGFFSQRRRPVFESRSKIFCAASPPPWRPWAITRLAPVTTTAASAMTPKGASTSPGLASASVAATEKRRSTTTVGRAEAAGEERGERLAAGARAGWDSRWRRGRREEEGGGDAK